MTTETTPQILAQSNRHYLVAPAGCGKTQLIVEAVACADNGRQLILTHTNAGVDALQRRLKRLQVPRSKFHVDTIAGWALRYATAFPGLAGTVPQTPDGYNWNRVYESVTGLLQSTRAAHVVRLTYAGVYVDEYQDCTIDQHQLIVSLAHLLPCRLLGDPLQGIFGFGKEQLVDWDSQVSSEFAPLLPLAHPWRWSNTNLKLGAWLLKVRSNLLQGQPIDLRDSSVNWVRVSDEDVSQKQYFACLQAERHSKHDTVVLLQKWPEQCYNIAKKLQGRFSCVEALDSKDLFKAAEKLEQTTGPERAVTVLEFAAACMTGITTELKSAWDALKGGKIPKGGRYKHPAQIDALAAVATSQTLLPVIHALNTLCDLPGTYVYRRELTWEMRRALAEYLRGDYENMTDAVWHVRNRTRQMGRSLSKRIVGRTLLVKGLEFDHCVVLDASGFDAKNLYVALSRGSKSLTVVSRTPLVKPL